ncbi:DUF4097 domain-containing protein [Tissierella creatinini]|nr:DUF4097 domain-containing protein [Tissierella creatinini]TJX67507.1 DUF4097 domain-containing protein [Soehngenia saccharolytica]
MELKRVVLVLVLVMLLGFGVGIYSLIYNDDFTLSNLGQMNLGKIDIDSGNSNVKVGIDGIEIRDGDNQVIVNWGGVKVTDGENEVVVGPGEIGIKDSTKKQGFGWNWFNMGNQIDETINEEKFESLTGIDDISISSAFVDIKVVPEAREDIRIKYSGRLKANVIPELKTESNGSKLNISLETNSLSYIVTDSTTILQVFIPMDYEGNYNISTSSGDISADNLIGDNIQISSNSGDLTLAYIESGNIKLSTSSGNIKSKEIHGYVEANSSSGDLSFNVDGSTGNYKVNTSSGDVKFNYGTDSNYEVRINTSSGDLKLPEDVMTNMDNINSYEFKIGSGEKDIIINTSSGDIDFIH